MSVFENRCWMLFQSITYRIRLPYWARSRLMHCVLPFNVFTIIIILAQSLFIAYFGQRKYQANYLLRCFLSMCVFFGCRTCAYAYTIYAHMQFRTICIQCVCKCRGLKWKMREREREWYHERALTNGSTHHRCIIQHVEYVIYLFAISMQYVFVGYL